MPLTQKFTEYTRTGNKVDLSFTLSNNTLTAMKRSLDVTTAKMQSAEKVGRQKAIERVQSHKGPEELKSRWVEQEAVSSKERVHERGFMFCENKGVIEPGPEHVGGKGSITIRDCHDRKKGIILGGQLGYFHTHPNAMSTPSNFDAVSLMHMSLQRSRPVLYCQGGTEDKKITCETLKEMPSYHEYDTFRIEAKKYRGVPDNIKPYISELKSFYAADIPAIMNPIPEPIKPIITPGVKARVPLFPHIPQRKAVLFPHW
jgi:hypothetical protein